MPANYLIHGGTVVDGNLQPARLADVLVEGEHITAVGSEASDRARHLQGVQRIDASGMTVMPGLIDAHVHLSFDDAASNPELFHQRRPGLASIVATHNARKLLRAGVTGILDPDSVFECMVDVRDAIEARVVEGPRIACGCYALIPGLGGTAGRLINDTGVTGYYKVVNGADEIVAEVRRQVKVGADWIKVHVSGIAPRYAHLGEQCSWLQEELDLIVRVAHDLGVPVLAHCRGRVANQRAARAGVDVIHHGTGMDEETIGRVIDQRIPVCPAFTFQANMVDFGSRFDVDPALISLFEREIIDSVDSLKRLYRAGVPLLSGSESGFTIVPYGQWHYREMEVFTRYLGLSSLEAIHAATGANAFSLKMAGQTGVIAAGMKADVIVVAGDPVADLGVLGEPANIRHVFVDGRPMDLSEPDERRPLSGWRVPSMGRELTRDFVFDDAAARAPAPLQVQEL